MAELPHLRRPGPTVGLPIRSARSETMDQIRRRFLSGGHVGDDQVPRPILRSWQRCLGFGLAMDRRPAVEPIGRAALGERRERAERLRAAAAAEIRQLHRDAEAAGAIVVLTDDDGFVLETLGTPDFADAAARVALSPGVDWREAMTGTNAIGTALAERRDITVNGAEHFFEQNRILACSAAPILGPRGEMLGVLDLSNHAAVQPVLAPALVRRAVGTIEHRLFAEFFDAHDLVQIDADPGEVGGPREGLLAFEDDRLVGANRRALALLDLEWDALGRARWSEIFAGRRTLDGAIGRLTSLGGRPLFGRLRRPFSPARAYAETTRAARPATRDDAAPPAKATKPTAGLISDEARARALARATRLVDADVPVLVQGETGAGKEVFARALHAASARADRPFVAINCAALPETLIEAELFGYADGAFTGARKGGSKGLMREADGGVLFLDEIGDMPLALQARLLRALQEREVTPLGGGRPVAVDFALVCATHHGLAAAVDAGRFRRDLYFRIAQYTVELAPLRDRPDLRAVIETLWADIAGASRVTLAPAALDRLAAHDWPGNFRQLTTTLKTLSILAEPGEMLEEEALPADIRRPPHRSEAAGAAAAPAASPTSAPPVARPTSAAPSVPPAAVAPPVHDLAGLERAAMRAALDACGGNVTRAAARLGIHRSTLHRQLRNAGLLAPEAPGGDA